MRVETAELGNDVAEPVRAKGASTLTEVVDADVKPVVSFASPASCVERSDAGSFGGRGGSGTCGGGLGDEARLALVEVFFGSGGNNWLRSVS